MYPGGIPAGSAAEQVKILGRCYVFHFLIGRARRRKTELVRLDIHTGLRGGLLVHTLRRLVFKKRGRIQTGAVATTWVPVILYVVSVDPNGRCRRNVLQWSRQCGRVANHGVVIGATFYNCCCCCTPYALCVCGGRPPFRAEHEVAQLRYGRRCAMGARWGGGGVGDKGAWWRCDTNTIDG